MTEMQKKQILSMRKEGKGYKLIASLLGLSRDAVRGFCKSRNIDGFGVVASLNTEERIKEGKVCLCCYEKMEQPKTGRQKKFCSDKCRREWWKKHNELINRKETAEYKLKCAYCGKDFISYGNKNRKYCSHYCYIHDRFWKKEEGRI